MQGSSYAILGVIEALALFVIGGAFMFGLKEIISRQDDVSSILSGIEGGLREQMLAGLSGSARTLFLSSIYEQSGRPMLVVTHNLLQAQKLYDDIVSLAGESEVFLYPANELIANLRWGLPALS